MVLATGDRPNVVMTRDHGLAFAQGLLCGLVWTSHKIFKGEVEELQKFFSRMLKLPEKTMEESRW